MALYEIMMELPLFDEIAIENILHADVDLD